MLPQIGERMIDTIGGLGGGTVIDRYMSYHDNPRGQAMLVCRFGQGPGAVTADRLPGEVRAPSKAEMLEQAAAELNATALVDIASFNRLAGTPGVATLVRYRYHDHNGEEQSEVVVATGEISAEAVAGVLANLEDGRRFIPGQVGLDDLQERMGRDWSEEIDHPWHEVEQIALTTRRPTIRMHAVELARHLLSAGWDEDYRPECAEAAAMCLG
jgi:hypothetical protein